MSRSAGWAIGLLTTVPVLFVLTLCTSFLSAVDSDSTQADGTSFFTILSALFGLGTLGCLAVGVGLVVRIGVRGGRRRWGR